MLAMIDVGVVKWSDHFCTSHFSGRGGRGKEGKKEAIGWIKQKNSIDLNWTGPEKFDKCNILLSIYNKLNCAKAEPSGISKYFNIINTKVMIRYI